MKMIARIRSFARGSEGAAALEMGLIAPFLILGLVAMMDLGLALGDRMELDRNVRAGVQAVMSHVTDPVKVKNLILASTDGAEGVAVTVAKRCTCGSVSTSCTAWCTGGVPPSVFVDISVTKPRDNILLSDFNLGSQTYVQLR